MGSPHWLSGVVSLALAGISVSWLPACGSAAPPPESPSSPEASESPSSPLVAEPQPESEPEEIVSPVAEEEPSDLPDPAVICEHLCQRVERECKKPVVEACRVACGDYVAFWQDCPVEVEEALTCQTDASDAMVCTNLAAASCVREFTALTDCRTGREAPKARRGSGGQSESEDLPSGWHRFEHRELAVSVPFPKSGRGESDDSGKRLLASEGGIDFLVDFPPRPKGELTDRSILRLVTEYLGPACQKGLKVHGRFETGSVVHVHFETSCKDGVEWRGILHVGSERAVITSARSSNSLVTPDVSSRLESLFYGFRFLSDR